MLQINILFEGQYVESQNSPTFPGLPIIELINELVAQSVTMGRSPSLRLFRDRIKQLIVN